MLVTALLLSLSLPLSLFACGDKDDGDDDGGAEDGGAGDGGGEEVTDADGDGYDALASGGDDCDDDNGAIHPGATEVCNEVDDDCDGLVDDADDGLDTSTASNWYEDADRDGYGGYGSTVSCQQPPDTADRGGDCDDSNAEVNPDATEVCNEGVDDDCNGAADDLDASLNLTSALEWYDDGDGDGYGAGSSTLACLQPEGASASDGDCDDSDDQVFPGAEERCNGLDDDCDPSTGEDGTIAIDGTPYATVQAAINAAGPGDVVSVCAGTYTGDLSTTGPVTLVGVDGPSATILQGTGRAAVLTVGDDLDLSGFTVQGGSGFAGGGIDGFSSEGGDITLSDCIITDNRADYGGGVLSYFGELSLSGCEVTGNTASQSGGGIYAVSLALSDVDVHDNDATYGGGVYVESIGAELDADTQIYGNHADEGLGGGLCAALGAVLSLDGTLVSGNSAAYGGGVFIENGAVLSGGELSENSAAVTGGGLVLGYDDTAARDVQILGNTATYGGGMGIWGTGTVVEEVELRDNVASSWGGGMVLSSGADAELGACTLDGNEATFGGGLYAEPEVVLTLAECALQDNVADDSGGGIFADAAFVEVSGGSVTDNAAGESGGGAALTGSWLTVLRSDWGEGGVDNSPDDVYLLDVDQAYADYGSPSSFECLDTGCE